MTTLIVTIIIAFVLTMIAIVGLAISWFITGKSSIIKGACGMDPNRIRDSRCGTPTIHCELCENTKPKEERVAKHVQKYEVESEAPDFEGTTSSTVDKEVK